MVSAQVGARADYVVSRYGSCGVMGVAVGELWGFMGWSTVTCWSGVGWRPLLEAVQQGAFP